MMRTLCIATGLILAVSAPLWDQCDRVSDPGGSQLAQKRGGDPAFIVKNYRCDSDSASTGAGTYLGCKQVASDCVQCVTLNADGVTYSGATFNKLITLTNPVSPGNEEKTNQPRQKCGNRFVGRCIRDYDQPSGFTCSGSPGSLCGPEVAVGAQVPLIGPPPDQG